MTSLRLRIFLMVFLVVVIAVGTVLLVASQGSLVAVKTFVGSSAARDQHVAVQLLADPLRSGEPPQMQVQVQQVGQALGARVLIVDRQGTVLADSVNVLKGQPLPVPVEWIQAQQPAPLEVKGSPAFLFLGYSALSGTKGVAVNPMPFTDTLLYFGPQLQTFSGGTVTNVAFSSSTPLTSFPGGVPAQLALDTINRSLLLAALAAGGVALLLTASLSRGIVGPVEALTLAARRMERGDLSQRVRVRARDEIGELAHAFNAMADSLNVSEQLRRQMVTDIAHELRTPLTNIRGYLEAVRDGVVSPRPEVINSLYEESLLLNRLVDDLQELALAESGQLGLRRQACAVGEIAERALAALPPQMAGGPALRLELPADLPLVDADPERIGQVLRNLVTNAQHHTLPDGCITVSARARAGEVEIAVSDTGSGIASEHLPYVFERFYRADPARARTSGGAGLGLAIVKQLVLAHGGQVAASSRPGAGATFTFTLPRAAPQTPATI
jgi:signal transduction histidine kinase